MEDSPADIARFVFIPFGMGFVPIAVASYLLHFVVALRSPPTRRAAWTAGIPYLLTALAIFVYGGPIAWAAPLAPLPGMLLAYWYWRREFRQAWVDDPESLADGEQLADDDWRLGLIRMSWVIVAAVLLGVLRWVRHGL